MTIAQQLNEAIDHKLRGAWVTFPGIVKKLDRKTMRCDILPKAHFKDRGLPYLVDLPIAILRGGNSVILPAIKNDDVVLVAASTVDLRSLLESEEIPTNQPAPSIRMASSIVLHGLALQSELGGIIVGSETLELPASGVKILSDEPILIEAPDLKVVSDEGVGVEIDSTAGPGIDLETTGPISLEGSIIDVLQTALRNIKHRTSDPVLFDLSEGEVNTGLVGGVAKIYFKKGSTIYVFNHDATIT